MDTVLLLWASVFIAAFSPYECGVTPLHDAFKGSSAKQRKNRDVEVGNEEELTKFLEGKLNEQVDSLKKIIETVRKSTQTRRALEESERNLEHFDYDVATESKQPLLERHLNNFLKYFRWARRTAEIEIENSKGTTETIETPVDDDKIITKSTKSIVVDDSSEKLPDSDIGIEDKPTRRLSPDHELTDDDAEIRTNPWCPMANECKRSLVPLCGYAENFGYGQFDDMCHLVQVNCFYKYNFIPSEKCQPH